jgi:ribonuclease HI
MAGYAEAGVVCQDNTTRQESASFALGRFKGDSKDAEVFAIAAALRHAKAQVQENSSIKTVRIFTDAQFVLQTLRNGTPISLGPMLEPKMALEDLYDWADCVTSQHVTLELHLVK